MTRAVINNPRESVLLVQTAFLGDIVLSTPVIGALKNRISGARLSVLTTAGGKELLKNDPRIDEIIVLDKKGKAKGIKGLFAFAKELQGRNFTCAYSLHKSARTALLLWLARIPTRVGFKGASLDFLYTIKKNRIKHLHDVERNLSLVGKVNEEEKELSLFASAHLPDFIKQETIAPYIVISPGSMWKTKRWSATHFQSVVSILSQQYHVYITGSAAEKGLCDFVCKGVDSTKVKNLAGRLSLTDTIGIIAHSVAVICNDSLPLHIASAFKKPVIALFCATSPAFGFGPWRTAHKVLEVDGLACKPCMRHGGNVCPTGTELCRRGVSPEEVVQALRELYVK